MGATGVRRPRYGIADALAALRAVGIQPGDVVFTHSSVGMLGAPEGGLTEANLRDLWLRAFREALGPGGTWVLPTYTYSYTKAELFDPEETPPSNMGLLPAMLWRHADFHRSLDPLFSVCATGAQAAELTASAAADDCFGASSLYALLLARDAVMCNIGIGSHSALVHHVEQSLGVTYRSPKLFSGVTRVRGVERATTVRYNVRDLAQPRHQAYMMRLDADARRSGAVQTQRLGRGEVNAIRARAMRALIVEGLARDPEYMVLGDGAEPAPAAGADH